VVRKLPDRGAGTAPGLRHDLDRGSVPSTQLGLDRVELPGLKQKPEASTTGLKSEVAAVSDAATWTGRVVDASRAAFSSSITGTRLATAATTRPKASPCRAHNRYYLADIDYGRQPMAKHRRAGDRVSGPPDSLAIESIVGPRAPGVAAVEWPRPRPSMSRIVKHPRRTVRSTPLLVLVRARHQASAWPEGERETTGRRSSGAEPATPGPGPAG